MVNFIEERKNKNHKKNRKYLARELDKMSKCEEPYKYFIKIPGNVLGMINIAAWYLDNNENE